jgi:hypothetical protein
LRWKEEIPFRGRETTIMTDRACPLGFLVATAFASGLIWVFALMGIVSVP